MAYALFKDEEKLSRTFSTKEETLKKADDAGLVEEREGEPVLDDDLKIKPCSTDRILTATRISIGRRKSRRPDPAQHPLPDTLGYRLDTCRVLCMRSVCLTSLDQRKTTSHAA
jgi:hypothetical protein